MPPMSALLRLLPSRHQWPNVRWQPTTLLPGGGGGEAASVIVVAWAVNDSVTFWSAAALATAACTSPAWVRCVLGMHHTPNDRWQLAAGVACEWPSVQGSVMRDVREPSYGRALHGIAYVDTLGDMMRHRLMYAPWQLSALNTLPQLNECVDGSLGIKLRIMCSPALLGEDAVMQEVMHVSSMV